MCYVQLDWNVAHCIKCNRRMTLIGKGTAICQKCQWKRK